jgi:hypothetical protein
MAHEVPEPTTIVDLMRTPEMTGIEYNNILRFAQDHLPISTFSKYKEWYIFTHLSAYLLMSATDEDIKHPWIPYKAPKHPTKWAPGRDFSKEETYVKYMYKRIKNSR